VSAEEGGSLSCEALARYAIDLKFPQVVEKDVEDYYNDYQVSISYQDDEGDLISIAFTQELEDAILLSLAQDKDFLKLRVNVVPVINLDADDEYDEDGDHPRNTTTTNELLTTQQRPSSSPATGFMELVQNYLGWGSSASLPSSVATTTEKKRRAPEPNVFIMNENTAEAAKRARLGGEPLSLEDDMMDAALVDHAGKEDQDWKNPSIMRQDDHAEGVETAKVENMGYPVTTSTATTTWGVASIGAPQPHPDAPGFVVGGPSAVVTPNRVASAPIPIAPRDIIIKQEPNHDGAPQQSSSEGSSKKRKSGGGTNSSRSSVKKHRKKQPSNKQLPAAGAGVSTRERICNALLEWHALGISEPSRIHVALYAGYTNCKSAGFAKALTQVKSEGLIEYPNAKTLRLSQHGLGSLPKIDPPKNNKAAQERLCTRIAPKACGIFRFLHDGQVHDREEVALASGYTNLKSAGFAKALGTLSGLGIMSYPDKKSVQLTDIAFPYGRPQWEDNVI
jgi:hypothetical protein